LISLIEINKLRNYFVINIDKFRVNKQKIDNNVDSNLIAKNYKINKKTSKILQY